MHGLIFEGFRAFLDDRDRRSGIVMREHYDTETAYPDVEFEELVGRAAAALGLDRRTLLLEFGSFTGRRTFAELFPDYYAESPATRPFLLSVEERIHGLVRRVVPAAAPPRLHVTPLGDVGVAITYTSDRGLCDLLEGLVRGTADYYGERVEIEQPQCMMRGDLACAFFVTVSPGRGATAPV